MFIQSNGFSLSGFQYIHRVVYNLQHYEIPEHFHYLEKKLCTLWWSSPILPSLQGLATTNLISVPRNVPLLDISHKWKYLASFTACFQGSSLLYHVTVLLSFSWLNNTPLYKYTTFCLSIHDLMDISVVSTF